MPRARRILVVFWLVAGLCLQGLAPAGEMAALGRDGDVAHAALHLEAVAHHHGEDGSIKKDDSKKSLEHLKADGFVQVGAVLPQGVADVAAMPLDSSRAEPRARAYDPPFLEGLMRPPR
jgi:hypothetical protein